MAIDRSFNQMLTEKLHPELLKNEIVKRTYIMQAIDHDNEWVGGNYGFGFEEAGYSSVAFDALTAENDIAEAVEVRGNITEQKILSGSMVFNHRDLIEHNSGKITEKSFLKILPRAITDFVFTMKNVVAQNLLTGRSFAKGIADGDANGKMRVNRVDRFQVGMKIEIEDDDTALTTAYVKKVSITDPNDQHIILHDGRGSGSAVVSTVLFTNAANIKFYHPGGKAKGFSSLKEILLIDPTEGGLATMYGVNKVDYSFLQNIEFDGNAITSTNILDQVFDFFTQQKISTASNAGEVWVSYKHFGSILKKLNSNKTAFNVVPNSRNVSEFGWDSVSIGSVSGEMIKIVAMKEMDDDIMFIVDPKTFCFATNGMFRKIKSPEGLDYYTVRSTSGYKYICDWEIYGEIFCKKPQANSIIKNISY